MTHNKCELFKTLLRVQVQQSFPTQTRGRPTKLTFNDAYDDILRVIRTGMQWRQLRPKDVSHITVFKTMHKWVSANVFETAYRNLLRLYKRKRRPRYYCIDSSFIKNIYGTDCIEQSSWMNISHQNIVPAGRVN